ncbi:MAG: site-2 protease family protein [Saprospiraceae bacterium]|nr:site-2 protease family protein [Saprospiraceae bacterium]
MRGSVQIAKIFGIPVKVHWSFALLFLFVIYVGKSREASWTNIALFGLTIVALFVCVLLHEFGHALSARYFGIKTQDVTILPIGGVARLNKLPEKPFQEFIVAIAGPAVNVVIYVVLALWLYFQYSLQFSFQELLSNDSNEIIIDPTLGFFAALTKANFMLVVFNMIPAFPMDGGRVLRALLSMSFGRVKATKLATILGQVISIAFFVYALLPAVADFFPESPFFENWRDAEGEHWGLKPILALIAGFVFYTARQEYQQILFEEHLSQWNVNQIMRPVFTTFQTSDPMHIAIQELANGQESNFLVFDDAHILRGILQEPDMLDAMKNRHYDALVSSYASLSNEKAMENTSLKEIYEKMYRTNVFALPVVKEDNLIVERSEVLGIIELLAIENLLTRK